MSNYKVKHYHEFRITKGRLHEILIREEGIDIPIHATINIAERDSYSKEEQTEIVFSWNTTVVPKIEKVISTARSSV